MQSGWGEELTEEETQALLQRAADQVVKRRLEVPAVLALEMHKPISGYMANMAIIFAPFIGPIFGPDTYRDFSRLLTTRHNVERLILLIEDGAAKGKMERLAS